MQLARRIEQCLGFECECEAPGDTSRLVTRLADIRIGQVAVGGTCIAFGDNEPDHFVERRLADRIGLLDGQHPGRHGDVAITPGQFEEIERPQHPSLIGEIAELPFPVRITRSVLETGKVHIGDRSDEFVRRTDAVIERPSGIVRFERRPVAIVEILHSASGIAEFGIVRGAVAHRLFDRPEILRDVRIDVGEHLLSIVEILIDIVVRIESVRFVEVEVIARNENGSTQQGRYDSICFHPVYRLKIELHACPVRPHRRIRSPQLFGINGFQIVQTEEVRTLQINLHIREAKNPFGQRIGNGQVTQFDEGTVPIPIRIVPVVVRIRQGCQSRHGRLRSAFG